MKFEFVDPKDFKDPGFKCPACKGELKVVTHPDGSIQKWCENSGCGSKESWMYPVVVK